ncbi:MAG: DNA (cytosine-5)-methyltransferase 1 [Methyloprofundus sp.]|nr:MAG: DNA (cytosine-5)-methyltransferase 1 [Methyloprofundus sp.]
MSKILDELEVILFSEAELYTPVGSEPKAVIHQWAHAIAHELPIFGKGKGADKKSIIRVLKEKGVFKNKELFLHDLISELPIIPPKNAKFTFIDLFAGIGGMRLGAQNNGGVCVFSSEFEKNAQQTYLTNHGEFPFGDITEISVDDIPSHDVLFAGFPCQPFSHAGLKRGIEDTRGTLFHNIAEILKIKKPKVAVLENVKGLVSHDKGYTLQVILKTLTNMGYSCNISKDIIFNGTAKELQVEAKKMVLKSIDFGVPQNRQRIYIVLWLDGLVNYFDYPKPLGIKTRVGDVLEESPAAKYTISDKLWAGHQRRKIQNKKDGKGFGFGCVTAESSYTNTISARYYKDGSEILIEQENNNPRKVTHREAARIQGFPDEFAIHPSNVQAYKQFGNSVSVPVIDYLVKNIYKDILCL